MEEKKNTTSLLFATTASSSNLHAENNMIKSGKNLSQREFPILSQNFVVFLTKFNQSYVCLI